MDFNISWFCNTDNNDFHNLRNNLNRDRYELKLKTACLLCNSIKSGKTFEEAAPLILKSLKERKQRAKQ